MMKSSEEFRRLAERFRECRDETPTKEVAAQAVRVLHRASDLLQLLSERGCPIELLPLDRPGDKGTLSDVVANRERAAACWQSFLLALEIFPEFDRSQFMPNLRLVHNEDDGTVSGVGRINPGDWPQVALLWSDVCDFLAEQLEESAPPDVHADIRKLLMHHAEGVREFARLRLLPENAKEFDSVLIRKVIETSGDTFSGLQKAITRAKSEQN